MLAYIKGELVSKTRGYVVVDVGGLGYKIYMSEIAMENVGNIGDIVKIHTYYRVMEDDISIFGFNTGEELRLFEFLISVSGIGAKTAITMLGSIEPSDFAIAVISDDIDTLKKLPGIGAKTAQRVILELKDKLKKEQAIEELDIASNSSRNKITITKDRKLEDAQSALQVLGYGNKEIEKVLEKVYNKDLELEDLIKAGLKEFQSK